MLMRTFLHTAAMVMALAGGLVLLAITLVTMVNVGAFTLDRVARMFGGTVTGLAGYEDFVRLAVGGAILMMFPYCQFMRGHIAVDLFVSNMPRGVRLVIDKISLVLLVGLAAFLAWWMGVGMIEARSDALVSRVLGWAEWPFYIPGIAGLVLWGVIAAWQLSQPPEDA